MQLKFVGKKNYIFVLCVVLWFVFNFLIPANHPAVFADSLTNYFEYTPSNIEQAANLSGVPQGQAVPILLYHGVTPQMDSSNTEQHMFISQMEMLKQEGYQTITLEQLDDFLHGRYILPPKPIIITFDDGRKDSYYPTDNILKKLGFTATLFEVSGKADDHDAFFLSWDELLRMKSSGRWDIQAHGTYSHIQIPIDAAGTAGRFLSSRLYRPGTGLETIPEFEKRVENDYCQNIADLKKNLNCEAKYYAIPLNNYGLKPTNYPESLSFNDKLVKKYFRMAFIQANNSENVLEVVYPFYNYPDADPYHMMRLEVQNMKAADLKKILEEQSPKPPRLLIESNPGETFKQYARLAYGTVNFDESGLHLLSTPQDPSARVEFGDAHWDNYTVRAVIKRVKGRSVVLLAYAVDNKNYLAFGMTDHSFFLRESVGGDEMELSDSVFLPVDLNQSLSFKMTIKDGIVTASVNDKTAFRDIKTQFKRGKVGFKVWDDHGGADGVLSYLAVSPANENN